jgi:hypothetical protein
VIDRGAGPVAERKLQSTDRSRGATTLLLRRVTELVARRSRRHKRGSRTAQDPAPPGPRPATRPAVARVALPAPDLQEVEAQARYHRDRLALYRARVLSAKPSSAARLRELQRISTAADARLRDAARRDRAD